MFSPDNAGLEILIDALSPIVTQYATPTTGLLRADIWALADFTGAEISQTLPHIILFSLQSIGHIHCNSPLRCCPV